MPGRLEYTPTTDDIREQVDWRDAFDRWLDAHDREEAAAAIEEIAEVFATEGTLWHGDFGVTVLVDPQFMKRMAITDWLRDRARTIREATS
ncbi:hypothetical protein [Agromyces cerinus]|uniref:hypothetical protein n=1 Tax=Agromyces cerinus TaxID=33878 RepID=UPI001177F29A|nr:hypothetical protein [Agromyces cerinus]